MCKMVFDGFCLADRSYLTNRKNVRGKFNVLSGLQILIRSVVPKSSYEGRTKSNFNIKGIHVGPAKSWETEKSHIIFRFVLVYMK